MQVALRANLVASCIPAKVKIGFDWRRAKEGHSLFVNKRIEKQNEAHVIEGFMGFAQAIGVPSFKPSWQMPVAEENKAFAKKQLSGLGKTLVIAPAAAGAITKVFPNPLSCFLAKALFSSATGICHEGLKLGTPIACANPINPSIT